MTLQEILNMFKDHTIRIFAGPTTIFHGKQSDVSENIWNMKVGPYMGCEILGSLTHNETIILSI